MKNFKIRTKMLVGFGCILILIILLNGFAIGGIRKVSNLTIEMYKGPYENSMASMELANQVREIDSILNNMIIKGSLIGLEQDYQTVKKVAREKVEHLSNKGALTDSQKEIFRNSMTEMEKSGQLVVDHINKGNRQLAEKEMFENFDIHMEKLADLADDISETAGVNAKTFFEEAGSKANFTIIIQDVLFALIVLLSFATAVKMARDIVNPIRIIGKGMSKMEQGDFDINLESDALDEFGVLNRQLMSTVEQIKNYIYDITFVLGDVSQGNIDLSVSREYVGDFSKIKISLNLIIDSLNETMRQISQCSQQVRIGSTTLSEGAQSLARGSQEQTAALENFQTSLDKVSELTSEDGKNASTVNGISQMAWERIIECDHQMKDMVLAMNEINQSSKEVAKIIKIIEDIAFQTNILALNAAVEAARAGAAGKGFAVVADEVRNLAGKSSKAVENTSQMIIKAINAVGSGIEIADKAAGSIRDVGDHVKEMKGYLATIDESTGEQEKAFQEMLLAIDQIILVVQTNSAAAEENSTGAEELSRQAELLEKLIQQFKLHQPDKSLTLR